MKVISISQATTEADAADEGTVEPPSGCAASSAGENEAAENAAVAAEADAAAPHSATAAMAPLLSARLAGGAREKAAEPGSMTPTPGVAAAH